MTMPNTNRNLKLWDNSPGILGKVITFGLPFAYGAFSDISKFRLLSITGEEVPIFIKPLLFWPQKLNQPKFIRTAKIQFHSNGFVLSNTIPVELNWEHAPRTTVDRTEAPIQEVISTNPKRAGLKEPIAMVLAAPEYYISTGILNPSHVALSTNSYDAYYFPLLEQDGNQKLDYNSPDILSSFLLDRSAALYIQAIRAADPNLVLAGYLAHEWYWNKVEVTGQNARNGKLLTSPIVPDFCLGLIDFGGVASTYEQGGKGCDTKYQAIENEIYHLAITGDDSKKPEENGRPSTKITSMQDLYIEAGRTCSKHNEIQGGWLTPYTLLQHKYTERDYGTALQGVISAYALTLDPGLKIIAETAIDNAYKMLTENPDGLGNNGYLSHSFDRHENWFPAWLGTATVKPGIETLSVSLQEMIGADWTNITEGCKFEIRGIINNVMYATGIVAAGSIKEINGEYILTLKTPFISNVDKVKICVETGADGKTRLWAMDSDRGFSPWMQAMSVKAWWSCYNLNVGDKNKLRALIVGAGDAIIKYGIDGHRLDTVTKAAIEAEYNIRIYTYGRHLASGGGITFSPFVRYFSNIFLADINRQNYANYINESGYKCDQHTPECLFQLALSAHFETDPERKQLKLSVAEDMLDWFDKYTYTALQGPPDERNLNWQAINDPMGTFLAVMNATIKEPMIDPPVVIPLPDPDPVKPTYEELESKILFLEDALDTANTGIETLSGILLERDAAIKEKDVELSKAYKERDAAEDALLVASGKLSAISNILLGS
jgi:hypothetical protein